MKQYCFDIKIDNNSKLEDEVEVRKYCDSDYSVSKIRSIEELNFLINKEIQEAYNYGISEERTKIVDEWIKQREKEK